MPALIIDNREIEVPDGTKVIEAAERLGIMIPRFCYHPALGSVGACRVCAVKVMEGGVKGIQMSCMLDVEKGMVVSTTDPEAVDFRRHVIEWLMLHHPHDCPVCDEGGHCLLQDMTVSGGHGLRRFAGLKRTYPDQDLGPLVQHEMNRCIHCYRCSRFYQEVTGYRDLGVMQIGNRTYFGRYEEGPLESPFAGNLSDICPTGVYTDKPSRYKGRRWDYERSSTVCINCSLGCHTTTSARYREIVRQEARLSPVVNGWFICDRGRFGSTYVSGGSRPREGRIDGTTATWDESIRAAADRLSRAMRENGADSVATVGSPRNSLETMAMLTRLSGEKGWRPPAFWLEAGPAGGAAAAVSRLEGGLAVSLQEVAAADTIVVVGADPLNEAPMLALAMRQAWRTGAQIFVLDPRPVHLPFDFAHLPVSFSGLSGVLESLLTTGLDPDAVARSGGAGLRRFEAFKRVDPASGEQRQWVEAAANALSESRRPVVVCGTANGDTPLVHLSADAGLWLQAMGKTAGVFYLLAGPNAFGAVMVDAEARSLESLLDAIDAGAVRTLVVTESDPLGQYPDRMRLEKALDGLDLLIVLDYLPTRTAGQAHVFIPTATPIETGGCFLNQEGRLQASERALAGGTPIDISGAGNHPPRVYGTGVPGADLKPAWQTLATLADRELPPESAVVREDIWKWLTGTREIFARLVPPEGIPADGVRFCGGADPTLRFQMPPDTASDRGAADFTLVLTDWTFGTEELSSRSPHLQQIEPLPTLGMHPGDAQRMGLQSGDQVALAFEGATIALALATDSRTAPGMLVMPRHHRLKWQVVGTGPVPVAADQIRKTQDTSDTGAS